MSGRAYADGVRGAHRQWDIKRRRRSFARCYAGVLAIERPAICRPDTRANGGRTGIDQAWLQGRRIGRLYGRYCIERTPLVRQLRDGWQPSFVPDESAEHRTLRATNPKADRRCC